MSFDPRAAGTASRTWDGLVAGASPLELAHVSALLVVAAHPDDETLGAGALLAAAHDRGIPVRVVMVTAGSTESDDAVIAQRSAELRAALQVLAPRAELVELGFRDSGTADDRPAIERALAVELAGADAAALVVAPWPGDGHRDHRVVGEVVAAAVGERRLLQYPIWAWHWAAAGDGVLDGVELVAVPSDERKRVALAAYPSQTGGDNPLLTEDFLAHFSRRSEVLVRPRPGLRTGYFDDLYAGNADPWRFQTRWYERRKRALTMAALPRERFGRALEVGCSIGLLTQLLAPRCDELVAIDVAEAALRQARERVDEGVDLRLGDLRDPPAGPFDLIVLSEVGYYLTEAELEAALLRLREALGDDGVLVSCHWRPDVDDYPLTGDEVQAAVGRLGLHRMSRLEEDDVVLEVHTARPGSVAQREGFR